MSSENEAVPAFASVSVLILAGGYSRRMGEEKALLSFGETTALGRLLTIAGTLSDDVLVARRPDQAPLTASHVVHDRRPGSGPLAGLEAGLAAAKNEWCVVLPVDAPGVTQGFLGALLSCLPTAQALGQTAVVTTEADRVHPLHAVYHQSVLPVIEKLLNSDRRKVLALLSAIDWRACPESVWRQADPQGLSVSPCNTPAEARALRASLQALYAGNEQVQKKGEV